MRGAAETGPAEPTHVLVFATLGAAERRRLQRRSTPAAPEPGPAPVTTGRVTVIEVGDPFADAAAARAWLARAGEADLARGLAVINRAVHAFRAATADPYVHEIARGQALVARVGYGAGEEVADGSWSEARELSAPSSRRRRAAVLAPQALLAAALAGRERALASAELALRARADLDHDRDREAALQLLVALDAALAELGADPRAERLAERLDQLRARRAAVAAAAQLALEGALDESARETVRDTLERLEAALRALAALSS